MFTICYVLFCYVYGLLYLCFVICISVMLMFCLFIRFEGWQSVIENIKAKHSKTQQTHEVNKNRNITRHEHNKTLVRTSLHGNHFFSRMFAYSLSSIPYETTGKECLKNINITEQSITKTIHENKKKRKE